MATGYRNNFRSMLVTRLSFFAAANARQLSGTGSKGTPVDELERRFTTNFIQGAIGYGDIVRIVEGTRFHLRSAHQILAALFPENPNFLARIDELLLRLEFGLPSSALPLTKLQISLTRGQYLALIGFGCNGVADVNNLSDQQLTACIGVFDAKRMRPSLKDPLVALEHKVPIVV
jgi:hypothetical protein